MSHLQPTVDNGRYFAIAGVLSFVMFFAFLGAFFYLLFYSQELKSYGLEKKTYISISLESVPLQYLPQKEKPLHKKKTKKKSKRKSVDVVNEDIDVDSLFDNVWTKKVDTKRKPRPKVDARRIQEIQKSIALEDLIASNGKKREKTSKEGKNQEKKATSSGDEVNQYLAKIHAIVYEYFIPPANTQGYVVRAVIELSPLGKVLDFRINDYSGSEALNEEAKRVKERVKNVMFPKNPENETARIIVILKPEEKE